MRKIIAGTVACLVLSASLFAVPIDPPVVSKLGGGPAPNAMQIQGATGMTPLQVQGVAGATSDVELHDHTTPGQHLAIDANGQIGINNFPAGGGGTDVAIHDFTINTRHLTVDASGQIGVTGTFWQATQPVSIATMPSTPVTGIFWQATQPVAGSEADGTTPGTANPLQIAGRVTATSAVKILQVDSGGRVFTRVQGGAGHDVATATGATTPLDAVLVGGSDGTLLRALKTATDGTLRIDPTGTTIQPVSGTFWPTTAASPSSTRLSDGAAFYDARSIRLLTSSDVVDVSDKATRLLGVVYGSQGQQLKQTATNFNLQSELAVGGTLIDPRAIRALTSSDVVTTVPPTDATTNITKFGGTNISTGTGAGGAGIPRVTISNDSSLAANQSVNVAQMNGVATSMNFGVPDTGTQRVVQAQAATYSASTTVKTNTTAGTGPFFNICGSGTKTIRVQQIIISGTVGTAAVWGDVILKKTSAATTAGTATTLTNVPLDSNSAAATATVKYYTALGTAGTLVGAIASQTQLFPVTVISATLQPNPPPLEFKWRDPDSEAPTLRGTAQCVEANFGTTTTNAPTLTVAVKWTEI